MEGRAINAHALGQVGDLVRLVEAVHSDGGHPDCLHKLVCFPKLIRISFCSIAILMATTLVESLVDPPLDVLPLVGSRLDLVRLVECHLLLSSHLGHAGATLAPNFRASLLKANLIYVDILNVNNSVFLGLLLLTAFLIFLGL